MLSSNSRTKYDGFKGGKSGQIMILAVIFFVCISTLIILAMVNPLIRHISMATSIASSKESFYAAEAGAEDTVYRLKAGVFVSTSNALSVGSHSVVTSVSDEVGGGKEVAAVGEADGYIRKVTTHLVLGTGVSFHYGIQAGMGGFILQNSSSVTGNVHSSGPVLGAGNDISGDVVSAGPAGIIDNIHVHGSAFAHTIQDSIVNNNASYATITDSTVFGTLYPGSADQPTAELPISDEQISEWESQAEEGGIIPSSSCTAGTYTVSSSTTIGPVKIDCNLMVKGNGVELTLAGPVWVVGNIETQTGPIIRMSPSLGSQNVALISDNPSDRTNGSIVTIGQNTQFYGSGFPRSFVFIISQNDSAETGGAINAFNMGQSAGALVAYASHGQITLGQSVGVKEATAYKIILQNTANVVYDTGLPSTLFSNGPSGGFDILTWREVE